MKYKNSLKPSNGFRWPETCFPAIVMSFALLSIHYKVKKSSIEQKFHKGYFVFLVNSAFQYKHTNATFVVGRISGISCGLPKPPKKFL